MSFFYIVTHKEIPWKLPFEHRLIGVEGFVPEKNEGVAACETISRLLDSETAFGALRALPVINEELKRAADEDHIFTGSYRLFLSNETHKDWLDPVMQENKIIHPTELLKNWKNLVATKIPDGIDIMIPAPRLLPDTILGQYSRVHHLDDLLLAVGCAIRAGLLQPLTLPQMLSSNTLIPYGNFAARKKIKHEFNDRLWWCANDFYTKYYTPRAGYQRRVIDFVFERIVSMAIVQMIVKNNFNCLSCRNIWLSDDGNYTPSI